jgi:hypothetical protein
MATHLVLLSTSALEPRLLGGFTRRNLKAAGTHVYVEKPLTPEEWALRQQRMPRWVELKGQGVRVRWRGATLQKLVGRSGRRQWVDDEASPPRAQQRQQSPQRGQGQQQGRQQGQLQGQPPAYPPPPTA